MEKYSPQWNIIHVDDIIYLNHCIDNVLNSERQKFIEANVLINFLLRERGVIFYCKKISVVILIAGHYNQLTLAIRWGLHARKNITNIESNFVVLK